jgi:hypothetical protein
MADALDWMIITGFGDRPIGALGFINDRVAVIASFYDDRDGNMDGKVSLGERLTALVSPISIRGSGVVAVAMAARNDLDVYSRDPTFRVVAAEMFTNFARGLVLDGVYAVYFSNAVSKLATPIAGRLSSNLVASFLVRKGMETAVRSAYNAATYR